MHVCMQPGRRHNGQTTIEYVLAIAVLVLGVLAVLAGPPVWKALRQIHVDVSQRIGAPGVSINQP